MPRQLRVGPVSEMRRQPRPGVHRGTNLRCIGVRMPNQPIPLTPLELLDVGRADEGSIMTTPRPVLT